MRSSDIGSGRKIRLQRLCRWFLSAAISSSSTAMIFCSTWPIATASRFLVPSQHSPLPSPTSGFNRAIASASGNSVSMTREIHSARRACSYQVDRWAPKRSERRQPGSVSHRVSRALRFPHSPSCRQRDADRDPRALLCVTSLAAGAPVCAAACDWRRRPGPRFRRRRTSLARWRSWYRGSIPDACRVSVAGARGHRLSVTTLPCPGRARVPARRLWHWIAGRARHVLAQPSPRHPPACRLHRGANRGSRCAEPAGRQSAPAR